MSSAAPSRGGRRGGRGPAHVDPTQAAPAATAPAAVAPAPAVSTPSRGRGGRGPAPARPAPLTTEDQLEAAKRALQSAPTLDFDFGAFPAPAGRGGGKKKAEPAAPAPPPPAAPAAPAAPLKSTEGQRKPPASPTAAPEISNRNRRGKGKGGKGAAAAAPDAAAEDGADGNLEAVDERAFSVTFSPDAPATRFRFGEAKHPRVKLRSETITIGGKKFLFQERSVPGQDDAVYEKNADVWENVPRGHCVVSIETAKGKFTPVGEMLGMRKFGYREAKYGRRSEVQTVVAIEKENGECAHVAAFEHEGEKYWLAGSKHVTIMFRDRHVAEDLATWAGLQRVKMAIRVAQMASEILAAVPAENRLRFHQALAQNGWTANAEVIFANSQHIVDYNEINDLRFYAISGPGSSADYGLCALGPDQAAELLSSCGLHAVQRLPRVRYQSAEYKAQIASIARRENSEGVVMYGEDATGKVVCMWKEKSYPYVMERIVREAIKGGKVGDELEKYALFRLSKQDKELREFFTSWEQARLPFLIQFAAWLAETKAFAGKDAWDVSSQWLTLQRKCAALDPKQRAAIAAKYAKNTLATGGCMPVLLCGPPGSGKSSLGRALFGLLVKAGQTPRWLNQDEAQADRKKFLAALEKAAKDPKVTHLIIDKSNLAVANRKDYSQLNITPAVTLALTHPEGDEALAQLCIDRVLGRGANHRTLRVETKEERDKTVKIIQSFVKEAQWPDDPSVVEISCDEEQIAILRNAYEAISTASSSPLPPFDSLNPEECLALSNGYESALAKFGTGTQLFASIKISNTDQLLSFIPPNTLPKALIVRSGVLHTTIKYFGGEMDPIAFVQHAARVGEVIDIQVLELVYDEKGAAFTVAGDFKSANAIAHVTCANAQGIPPVYSNELLMRPANQVKRVPIGKVVKGVFAFQ